MPKYPLEPLAELRKKKVEQATLAVAEAVRKREAAARALRGAELRRETAARVAKGVRTAELEALARGDLRARDLARAHAWAARAAAEQESLAGVVRRAGAAETQAREHVQEMQGTLASRSADARVVDGHRERWNDGQRRGVEAREEEALSETWRRHR
jgi:YscO-like protein